MKAFSNRTRNLVGTVVLGPLSVLPAILIAATFIGIFGPGITQDVLEDLNGWFLFLLVALLYSYGFTIIYGLPVYLILLKLQKNTFPYVFVASLVPSLILISFSPEMWQSFIIMGYFSLCVGLCCWFLVRNLSRDSSNK